MIGRETPAGLDPKTLRPIFRDREDFSGGHSLTDATIAALDASAALIVLCSTVSAGRPAVNDETRLFRSRHPDRPVIPVIVEGKWPENFPPALRYEVTADGMITDRPVTILGPDLRDAYDGKGLGLAKTVAGLTGINTDDVFRRAERARRRRNRFWMALAGVFLLLAIAASGSAIYAWQQLKTNEAFLNATLEQAAEIVDVAVAQAEKFNMPRTAALAILTKAEGLFEVMARYGRPTPELRHRKAWMLIQFARNYQILGNTKQQFAHAAEAYRMLTGLAAEKPDDADYQRSLAAAYIEVGMVQEAQGDLAGALKSYQDGLAILDRLAKADPGNAGWQRDLSVPYVKVGGVDPGNVGRQRDLSVSYEKIGDVQVAQGNLAGALKSYSDSLAISERLAKSDPGNAGQQYDLAALWGVVGDVQEAQGNLTGALKSYSDSLTIMERLAKSDPVSGEWQRDLAVSWGRVGNVQEAQGNLTGALKSYEDGLLVFERLAKSDPGKAEWQRDLAVNFDKLALAHRQSGDKAKALDYLQQGQTIISRLTKLSPDNAQWKKDLAEFNGQIKELAP